MSTISPVLTKRAFTLHEDWVVVVLGALLIALSLLGVPFVAPVFNWSNAAELTGKVFSASNIQLILTQFVYLAAVAGIGAWLTGKSVRNFALGFPLVYGLTLVALVVAGSAQARGFGLEAVIFSLLIGLLVSNVFGLPDWLRATLTTELFVKIGLVLLGTSVIFSDILKAGSLGLVQALVVVLSVWYFAFWLCRKLKVDDELTMMIASGVSICGVSAAIATSGAIKGDPKKLSYVISLVLITAIPMMIIMPYAARWMGLSQEVTGAWLGGSIDTTGAVVASGTLVAERTAGRGCLRHLALLDLHQPPLGPRCRKEAYSIHYLGAVSQVRAGLRSRVAAVFLLHLAHDYRSGKGWTEKRAGPVVCAGIYQHRPRNQLQRLIQAGE
jgi:hypothetical protein